MERSKTIYLDHASGTTLLPEVKSCISEWLDSDMGNPSSIHQEGRRAAAGLDHARLTIAQVLGAKPAEILFTSGATEANNLAILGAAETLQAKGRHIITCSTEHPSVLESCKALKKNGFQLSYLECDENGNIEKEVTEIAADILLDTGAGNPIIFELFLIIRIIKICLI